MNKIITYSGKLIDIFDLKEEDISILDISYGLSNLARFAGQVPFYSVAKHSIKVAEMLPDNLKLSGLLHDASEAYIGDIISPIKHIMKEYLEMEKVLMQSISQKWKLDTKHELINKADKVALENEKLMLFYKKEYRKENQEEIMSEFLNLFNNLIKEQNV